MASRLYVTTPIYYVNDRPHIGHAYCTILADAARRWHDLCGDETYFVTGTDEHGQKVQQAAARRGVDPQEHADAMHHAFKDLWPQLHCTPDQFIRTTEPRHKAVVQTALQQLWDEGLIVSREFEGWYCTPCERFWTEKDLKDGACPDCGRPVARLTEKNYFFLMSRFQQPLIDAVKSGRMEILPPGRANEVLGFLREPLQDLCISRPKARLSWGIELPFDPQYVTYVWFDALLNYVTALGGYRPLPAAPDESPGGEIWTPPPGRDGLAAFETWWPHVTHLLGKDILTTHAVYWPTMLMALKLPVPRRLVATGWWLMDDTKMSKSLGNVVDPLSLKDKYGVDVLRYFLLREMPVGQDSNFSEAALLRRNNADLANDLGNLVQRVVALAARHFDGAVPQPPPGHPLSAMLHDARDYAQFLLAVPGARTAWGDAMPVREAVAQMKLHRALADAMGLVQRLNGVLTADAPFRTVRSDPDAAALTLYHVLEGIRVAAMLLSPALPATAHLILQRIGWTGGLKPLADLHWGDLQAGSLLTEGPPLFPKHVLATVDAPGPAADDASAIARTGEMQAMQRAGQAPVAPAATNPMQDAAFHAERTAEIRRAEDGRIVDIDTFARCDLRVGQVLVAEAVPKSKKLLRLEVALGEAVPRQILSGIAETVAPADLVGRQVLVLANLPPRLMMGLQSHGMLLVAEDAAGRRVPLSPARPVPDGVGVK